MELIKSQVISISYLRMDRYALHYNLRARKAQRSTMGNNIW